MRSFTVLVVAGSLALAACGRAPEQATPAPEKATATNLKPLAQKKFGAAITEKTTVALDDLVLEHGAQFASKTVRTEGVVSAVCKSMGCWMALGDTAGQAHIKMAGHSFFVPKDASGHRAVVQGTVLKPVNSNDECAQEAKAQTGAVAKVEIEATAVEFLD